LRYGSLHFLAGCQFHFEILARAAWTRIVSVEYCHGAAAFGEFPRRRLPDALSATSYDDHLVPEIHAP
jgi:hypothetical protein